MKKILEGHGKVQWWIKLLQFVLCHILETVKYDDISRIIKLLHKCLRLSMPIARESTGLMQCFLIAANCSSVIAPSITYVIALLIIGSSFHWEASHTARLNLLSGQTVPVKLYSKYFCITIVKCLLIDIINRRLWENCIQGFLVCLLWYIFHIISD